MCYREKVWGIILIALGLGFLLSCFLQNLIVKIIFAVLGLALGLLAINTR